MPGRAVWWAVCSVVRLATPMRYTPAWLLLRATQGGREGMGRRKIKTWVPCSCGVALAYGCAQMYHWGVYPRQVAFVGRIEKKAIIALLPGKNAF